MKGYRITLALMLLFALSIPIIAFSQDEAATATIRTLQIEYYASSSVGVKIMYRGFDNVQKFLYLPKSFENKYYRFVMAPKGVSTHGLPVLLVRMRNQEVIFVDIYTKYLREKAVIADFDSEDLENFREAEEKGRIELDF
jgi:hypothetical protein